MNQVYGPSLPPSLIDRVVSQGMVKSTPNAFYAVARGRNPGVYRTWDDCEEQVADVKGARYKKFSSEAEALAYVEKYNGGNSRPSTSAQPQASTGTSGASSSKQQKPYREGWLTVYCDGASKNNGKPNAVAGVGVWWGKDDDRNIAERCPGAQTNNRAELIALIRALETTPLSQIPLLVRTDSKYTIKCFTEWIRSWRAQGWMNSKGQPVKNREVISYADALLEKRKSVGQKVELDYVPGHKGYEGNEGADGLANAGCTLPREDDRNWGALEAEVRRSIHTSKYPEVIPPVFDDPPMDESISAALTRRKGKSKAVQPPVLASQASSSKTQPINIPVKRWATYDDLPEDWLADSSESSTSSLSGYTISIATTSASTSSVSSGISNVDVNGQRNSYNAGSGHLDDISTEELEGLILSNEELAKEIEDEDED